MQGYWVRQRLLQTIVFCAVLALISSIWFVFPYIYQRANNFTSQSIYKNTDIDFIAPEPAFDQVEGLPGTNGINKVFPFYLTNAAVIANGKERTTTILLSDKFKNADFTMYNEKRLIKKSDVDYENPVLVDWQFAKDMSIRIGDAISFILNGESYEYKVYAIYETNSIYDGGAILGQISEEQKNNIQKNANNNGYSGMYVDAENYDVCKSFLNNEYKPLGRLKSREQFENEEQYKTHYDAIMSQSYGNEITDFHVKAEEFERNVMPLLIWIGSILTAVLLISFNVLMSKRGCEHVYFEKNCIPKGLDVKPFYKTAFIAELIISIAIYSVGLIGRICFSKTYISKSAYDLWILMIPIVVIATEIICKYINYSKVDALVEEVKKKTAKLNQEKNMRRDDRIEENIK